MAFMIHRVAALKFSSSGPPCGLWDRQIKSTHSLSFLAIPQGPPPGSMTVVKSWVSRVPATRPLERHTAKHAVLWENGSATEIGPFPAQWWNTPTAINQHGDVAGFAGDPAFVGGDV